MGRGKDSQESNLKQFYMKITGLKEGDSIRIEQTEVRSKDDLIKLDETTQAVWGELTDIKIRDFEPRKGEKAKELKIYLRDKEEGEQYIVSCGLNSIGRSVINSLLSLQDPNGNLNIFVFNKRSNSLPGVSVTFNGEKVGWKYSVDQLKPYITENVYKKRGQSVVEKEYHELDTFLLAELTNSITPKLNKYKSDVQKAQKDDKKGAVKATSADQTEEDDLPF
jgi:hypothetical protein